MPAGRLGPRFRSAGVSLTESTQERGRITLRCWSNGNCEGETPGGGNQDGSPVGREVAGTTSMVPAQSPGLRQTGSC